MSMQLFLKNAQYDAPESAFYDLGQSDQEESHEMYLLQQVLDPVQINASEKQPSKTLTPLHDSYESL